jgi:hypothetical protein
MSAGVVEWLRRISGREVWGFVALSLLPVAVFYEIQAQEASAPIVSNADQLSPLHVLPAGTQVHLRLLEPVASHTHQRGTRFRLEVAEVIAIDDQIVVPAGSPAIGEVIHAAKPGMSGKGGELILATRFLLAGEREVKLRSFTAGNGIDRLALAHGLGVTLGIPALFVVGKNLVLPTGTDVYAKVATDTSLPSVVGTWDAGIPQPSISESSTENNDENDSE